MCCTQFKKLHSILNNTQKQHLTRIIAILVESQTYTADYFFNTAHYCEEISKVINKTSFYLRQLCLTFYNIQ